MSPSQIVPGTLHESSIHVTPHSNIQKLEYGDSRDLREKRVGMPCKPSVSHRWSQHSNRQSLFPFHRPLLIVAALVRCTCITVVLVIFRAMRHIPENKWTAVPAVMLRIPLGIPPAAEDDLASGQDAALVGPEGARIEDGEVGVGKVLHHDKVPPAGDAVLGRERVQAALGEEGLAVDAGSGEPDERHAGWSRGLRRLAGRIGGDESVKVVGKDLEKLFALGTSLGSDDFQRLLFVRCDLSDHKLFAVTWGRR